MPTISDDFGLVTQPIVGVIDLGFAVNYSYPIAAELLGGGSLDLGLTTSAVTLMDDFGVLIDAVRDIIDLGSAP
jgi:hypothetical protein